MAALVHTIDDHFMPSGIRAGSDLSRPLRDALTNHAGVPLAYQPIIEEGSYDDFKACVFRACSLRACEVCLQDMEIEFKANKINFEYQQRKWMYGQPRTCITSVEVRLLFLHGSTPQLEITAFLEFMAKKYGYRYNRCSINRKAATRINDNYVTLDPSVEVEMEITWPYWT